MTRVAAERPPAMAPDWKTARMAGLFAAGLLTLGASGAGIYRVLHPRPTARAVEPAPEPAPLTANTAASEGVVPIAPPVLIPSTPAPVAEAPPASAPEPARPAPKPKAAEPKRETAPAVPSNAVRAALEESGNAPLPYPGVLKALRAGGGGASATIAQAVQARGVDFRATPDQLIELRVAGASDELLHAVVAGFRGPAPAPAPAPVTEAPKAAPPPAPVAPSRPAVTRLAEVRRLYVVPTDGEIDDLLREELRTQLQGKAEITNSAGPADAQLKIEVTDEKGNRVVGGFGRIFGFRSKRKAVVQIVESQRRKVLWSAEAGDGKTVLGAFSDGAKRLASRIARQLREDWSK